MRVQQPTERLLNCINRPPVPSVPLSSSLKAGQVPSRTAFPTRSDPVDHLGRSLELDLTVVSHMTSSIQIVRNQQRLGAFPACEKRRVNVTDGDRYACSRTATVPMFLQERLRSERGRGGQLGCDVEDS